VRRNPQSISAMMLLVGLHKHLIEKVTGNLIKKKKKKDENNG
jgi:hypothetical protein